MYGIIHRLDCRLAPFFSLALLSAAQALTTPQALLSHTTESLRGVSVVSDKIAWASGTRGTYLQTTDGRTWTPKQVPGAGSLDFRGVAAFSANEAFLMSSGPGDRSRIYHTSDGGRRWELQFTNAHSGGFFDCIAFWDRRHGVLLGDPIPDASGSLKFELLVTEDGKGWHQISSRALPPAIPGEGAFAASNSCLSILNAADPNIWFATGGKAARVFHSSDRGETWEVFETPIVHGADSQGIFSLAFRDPVNGVVAGGDYRHPQQDGPNLAFTEDGGKTWTLSKVSPQAYYSAVAYAHTKSKNERSHQRSNPGKRLFLVSSGAVYELRSARSSIYIEPTWKSQFIVNAIGIYPNGGALLVGSGGTMAMVPPE